jgi:hypothetical protein
MRDNSGKQQRSLRGTPVSIRQFDDGSSIVYFEDGGQQIAFRPRRFDEPAKPPLAFLYYWQVEQNRPDIETWEQIRQAVKTSRSES